jgi:hypothetical protein
MYRLARSIILTALLFIPATYIAQSKRPDLPFFDWNACPFEGCTYRQWTAQKTVVVYDTWKQGRRAIARVATGDKVVARTGVVITFKPGVIRMDRDLSDQNLKRGEIILTYTYRGEGYSAVWVHGKYDPSFDISFSKWPDGQGCGGEDCAATYIDLGRKEWWAKVTLKSKQVGWVNMDESEFDGVDVLG